MRWHFSKYVGCGNDFILFDNRTQNFPEKCPGLIKWLCNRHYGIGADGVILLESSRQADCCMRIFNSDGSEAEMCGNGLRCLTKWLPLMGFAKKTFLIEVSRQFYKTAHLESSISIEMGNPTEVEWDIPIAFENQMFKVHHLNTGVPHTILFHDAIDSIDLLKLGTHLHTHSKWTPRGTNVTIAQQTSPLHFKARTYERGVGETLACGTGAVALALAAAYQQSLKGPIIVHTKSNEDLKINFVAEKRDMFSLVTLEGPAECTFSGEIDLKAFFQNWESPEFECFSVACNASDTVKLRS